jgi:hypothetical protein
MAAQNAAEQFASRNAGPAAGAARAGPATVEEVVDSASGGEFFCPSLCPQPALLHYTALHCTLAGGRGDDQARQSDLL